MSHSKDNRDVRDTATSKQRARRAAMVAHEREKSNGFDPIPQAVAVRKPRDTGWTVLATSHGMRYHREIGNDLQLDVEMQVTTWIGSAVFEMVLACVTRGHATAEVAAVAIEDARGVTRLALPAGDE